MASLPGGGGLGPGVVSGPGAGHSAGSSGVRVLPAVDRRLSQLAGEPWWIPGAGAAGSVRPVPVDSVDYAQHNILVPYTLGPANRPGASAWWELFRDNGPLLGFVTSDGLPAGAPESERSALRAALLRHVAAFRNPEEQIGQEEQQRLRNQRKHEAAGRRTACTSLACVPWLQRLVLEKTATMDPYELGRRLSVAVRADDARLVVDRIEKQTRKTASEERKITLALINANITDGNMAGMLVGIHAFQEHIEDEVREAYEDARLLAERFPLCVQLTELCAGRDQQLQQLPIMWAQIASAFSDVTSASGSRDEWLMGCWAGFFEGFTAVTTATATVQASILSRRGGPRCRYIGGFSWGNWGNDEIGVVCTRDSVGRWYRRKCVSRCGADGWLSREQVQTASECTAVEGHTRRRYWVGWTWRSMLGMWDAGPLQGRMCSGMGQTGAATAWMGQERKEETRGLEQGRTEEEDLRSVGQVPRGRGQLPGGGC